MNDDKTELKLIHENSDHLSAKQLELVKHYQQQVKSHEQQKTLLPETLWLV
jgi:hypothetical protein